MPQLRAASQTAQTAQNSLSSALSHAKEQMPLIQTLSYNHLNIYNVFNRNNEHYNVINISSDYLFGSLYSFICSFHYDLIELIGTLNEDQQKLFKDVYFPIWASEEHDNVKERVKDDYMPALHFTRFIKATYELIKYVYKKNFLNPRYYNIIRLLIFIHEIFDVFLRAVDTHLMEIIDEMPTQDLNEISLLDVDYIPFHREKKANLPRGQSINELLKNFLFSDVISDYKHQIEDFQPEEFDTHPGACITQIFVNLINDFNFYVRFLPSVNMNSIKELYSIQSANKTRNAILNHWNNPTL